MSKDRAEQNPISHNLMTKVTEIRLWADLLKAEETASKYSQEVGKTAGDNRDWHDNFGFEQATRDAGMQHGIVHKLKALLENIQILEPRQETDTVGIGNTVRVKFAGEDGEEQLTVLGPSDSATRKDWISYQSPLGDSLLNHKVGDVVQYEVNKRVLKIEIVAIVPGDFKNAIEPALNEPEKNNAKVISPGLLARGSISFNGTSAEKKISSVLPQECSVKTQVQPGKKTVETPKIIPTREEVRHENILMNLKKRNIPFSSKTNKTTIGNGLTKTEYVSEFVINGQPTRMTLVTQPKRESIKQKYNNRQGSGYTQNEYSRTEVVTSIRLERLIQGRWIEVPQD